MKKFVSMIIVAVMVCGCEKQDPQTFDLGDRTDPELILQLNAKATETLSVGSNSFILEAYLWRDFMPGFVSEEEAQNGRPMISINWLVDINSVAIPYNITLVKQYVIYGDLVWESGYQNEEGPEQPPHKIEKISRKGPQWETGIQVDVIAEVRDSKTGKSYHLICKDITVIHTS